MKKKSIIISTIAVLIIVGLSAFAISKNINDKRNNSNVVQITIAVYDKYNKEIYNKGIETEEKYLSGVLEETKELEVKMEDSQYGKYITSILGIEQGDNYYWSYYINDEYANVGVSSCEVESNKVYTFKFEKFEY